MKDKNGNTLNVGDIVRYHTFIGKIHSFLTKINDKGIYEFVYITRQDKHGRTRIDREDQSRFIYKLPNTELMILKLES